MTSWEDYAVYQIGGGSGIDCDYDGFTRIRRVRQKGGGIGGFLRGIYRKVLPFLKKGGKAIGKEALLAGVDILDDVTSKKIPFKEAVRNRIRASEQNLKRKASGQLDKMISGGGYKKARLSEKRQLTTGSDTGNTSGKKKPNQAGTSKRKKKVTVAKKEKKKQKRKRNRVNRAVRDIFEGLKIN